MPLDSKPALTRDLITAPLGDPSEPEIVATAAFPESNAFGRVWISHFAYQRIANIVTDVVNGEKNDIFLTIENKSERNVTIKTIAGSITHPDTGKLIKNVRCILYSRVQPSLTSNPRLRL